MEKGTLFSLPDEYTDNIQRFLDKIKILKKDIKHFEIKGLYAWAAPLHRDLNNIVGLIGHYQELLSGF